MDFLKLARERYSVRKFASEAVSEKLDAVLEVGLAPTACNSQPQQFWCRRQKPH